jgi:hypothetical protein
VSSPILQYFGYSHLPNGAARRTSARICELAALFDTDLPDCAEKSAGLRKLLEAKDCFVRATLDIHFEGV